MVSQLNTLTAVVFFLQVSVSESMAGGIRGSIRRSSLHAWRAARNLVRKIISAMLRRSGLLGEMVDSIPEMSALKGREDPNSRV